MTGGFAASAVVALLALLAGVARAVQLTPSTDDPPASTLENCYPLNSAHDVVLEWTVDADIQFRMSGSVPGGYLAVGIVDPSAPEMHPSGADGVLMDWWGASTGSEDADCDPGCVSDTYMRVRKAILDSTESISDVSLWKTGTSLVAEFSRALDTGDSVNDVAIVPGTSLDVLYSCSASELAKETTDMFDEHDDDCYGRVSIDLGGSYSCGSGSGSGSGGGFSSPGGEVELSWEIDGDTSTMTLVGATTGWFCVGWGPNSNAHASGNDMIVGWIDSSGTPTLIDAYYTSSGKSEPSVDSQQDLTIVSSSELDGVSTIVFTRALDTGDSSDVAIVDATTDVYWAIGTSDGSSTTSYAQHSTRGTGSANLMSTGETTVTDDDTGAGGDDDGGGGSTGGADANAGGFTTSDGVMTIAFGLTEDLTGITFTLQGTTAGYLAIGWGTGTAHTNSDMLVAWVDSSGAVTVEDGYSSSLAAPATDSQQDATDVSGSEIGGTTTVTFSRLLDTGDASDNPVEDTDVYFFWAHSGSDDPTAYHDQRGTVVANLYSGKITVIESTFKDAGEALVVIVSSALGFWALLRWTHKARKYYRRRKRTVDGVEAAKKADVELGSVHVSGPDPSYRTSRKLDAAEVARALGATRGRALSDSDGNAVIRQRPKSQRYEPGACYGSSHETAAAADVQLEYKAETGRVHAFAHGLLMRRVPRLHCRVVDVLVGAAYITVNLLLVYVFNNELWLARNSFGALTSANALFVALPATRNSVLLWVLGLPFDHALMWHRFLGRWVLVCVTMHMLLYVGEADFSEKLVALGFGGWWACLLIFLTSVAWMRRNKFELFFANHVVFSVLFVLLGAYHDPRFAPYAIAVGVFYGLDRVIRFFWGAFPTRTTLLKVKSGGVVQLRFKKHAWASYREGSYVFLNFPLLGSGVGQRFSNLLQWHPFTISSSSKDPEGEVHIKSLGDFTGQLLAAAQGAEQMWVRVDGPYGKLEHNFRRYAAVLLVGGGVGVTPMISILKSIYEFGDYGLVKDVYLVWVSRDEQGFSWFRDTLDEMQAKADANEKLPRLSVWVYLTREQSCDHPNVVCGRPDVGVLFDTAMANSADCRRFAVLACGPGPLCDGVWDEAAARTTQGVRWDLHIEVFDF